VRRYFTARCIGMHVTLVVVLPVFVWLTWWQAGRALSGNTLSWAYTFEWPLFAGYACFVWWQLIHDEPTALQRVRVARSTTQAPLGPQDEVGWALNDKRDKRAKALERSSRELAPSQTQASLVAESDAEFPIDERAIEEEDPELAEYNRYLAELNAGPDPRRW
jgi:hypothetical protein